MFKFILEIIFTVFFVIFLIFNAIAGSWLLVTLDTIVVILEIINSILVFKEWRSSKKMIFDEKIMAPDIEEAESAGDTE